jgi:hypothetical protein
LLFVKIYGFGFIMAASFWAFMHAFCVKSKLFIKK